MTEILPGLNEKETIELRALMAPKVGPKIGDQQRLDRISRIKDLQSKVDKSPQRVSETQAHQAKLRTQEELDAMLEIYKFREIAKRRGMELEDRDVQKALVSVMSKLDPGSVVREGE